MLIEGVEISAEFDCSPEELKNYVAKVRERIKEPVVKVKVKLCSEGLVEVSYTAYNQPFERVRRITGYLTGDLNSWNNAKQAEERDRVKHDLRRFSS